MKKPNSKKTNKKENETALFPILCMAIGVPVSLILLLYLALH